MFAASLSIDRAVRYVMAVAVALTLMATASDAKSPGATYCFGGWCHRVSTLSEMDSVVGRRGFVNASFYDDCRRDRFNPCGLTSSGAVFRPDLPDNAASPIFPDGTILLVYNPKSKQAAVLRVNSAGPYRGNRTLDVSRAAAEHLGFAKLGVAELAVSILSSPNDREARYRKERTYDKVPGHMGTFESLEAAEEAAICKLRLVSAPVAAADKEMRLKIDAWMPWGLAQYVQQNQLAASQLKAPLSDIGAVNPVTARTLDETELNSGAAIAGDVDANNHPPSLLLHISAFIAEARRAAQPRAAIDYGARDVPRDFAADFRLKTEMAKYR
jgi:rare lipoprotein A